jgi:aromatic ring-opening dioxygenase catalytic subunit (LigB family)
MKQITLTIENHYVSLFLALLKDLTYVQVKKVEETAAQSPTEAEKLATLFALSGAWKEDRSAEAIIQDIHQSRLFTRTIDPI